MWQSFSKSFDVKLNIHNLDHSFLILQFWTLNFQNIYNFVSTMHVRLNFDEVSNEIFVTTDTLSKFDDLKNELLNDSAHCLPHDQNQFKIHRLK